MFKPMSTSKAQLPQGGDLRREASSPVAAYTLYMTLGRTPGPSCFCLFCISSLAFVIAAGGGFTPCVGPDHTSLSIRPLDPGDKFSARVLKSIDFNQL